jgi:Domain of unknown function (DUF1996)
MHFTMAGMSHRHDFYGNVSTTANSTVAQMLAAGSSCTTRADTAAYWTPAVLSGGQPIIPGGTSEQLYYRYRYPPGTVVQPIPTDLRVVVGNAAASSVATNPALGSGDIYWQCDHTDAQYALPPACGAAMTVENIRFPFCWDGLLTHVNDTAHLRYADDGAACPPGFPRALPRISLKVKYPAGLDSRLVTLSSGPAYTAHADFWNTWQPAGLRYLTTNCLNAGISCGTNPMAPTGY